MATASRTTSDPLTVSAWADEGETESKSERYLAKRLAAAGADYKGVALTTFLLAAGIGAMLWLGCGVIAEHWLVPGGLPAWIRWGWLAAGALALAAAACRWLLPLMVYRVNLVYAARMLEQEHPELHNDVVNAVLAQAHADESTPLVVKSLRRRAARQLKGLSGDGVVDRGLALRLAYVLATLIAVACAYELLAPKSLIVSAGRLVAPWLGVAAPARVRIAPPKLFWSVPGGPAGASADRAVTVANAKATLIRGRQLIVATEISGLTGDEKPALLVSPVVEDGAPPPDGWRAPLIPGAGGTFTALLADATRGLDQSVDIVIAAGDGRSDRLRIAVVDEPAMLVREVHYKYPPHTGQPPETTPWQGDIRGVEGTQVTVVAECNHPLDAAWIDLGPDGKRDATLAIGQKDLASGRGSFTLKLSPDRTTAEHARYRLLFQLKAASSAPRETISDKMEYRIEVLPDLAPEITIEEPAEKVVRVPPDAPVTVRLRAIDPDFGLASVSVETRVAAGAERPGQELLVGSRKTFRGAATLIPASLGAGPGQELEYRGVAKDTRPDVANVATTEWYKLKIDPSAPPRQPPPADEDEQPGEEGGAGEPQEGEESSDRTGTGQDGGHDAGGEQAGESGKGRNSGDGTQGEAGGNDSGKQDQGSASPEAQGGKQGGPKGAGGNQDGAQPPSQRQPDPQQGQQPGKPQEGEQQGSADGGKPKDDSEGKAGKQPGQQQQRGSQDGAGAEPEGQGGAQQQGGQQGSRPDGGPGGEQRPSGAGGEGEGRPGAKKPDGGGASSGDGTRNRAEGDGRQPDGSKANPLVPPGLGKGLNSTKEPIASDGTADGDAMERILEHRRQRQGQKGESESGERQPGDGRTDDRDDPSGQKPPMCTGADGQPCGKEECPSCKGAGTAGEGKPGEGKPGEGKPGEGKPGEGKPGEGKPGEGKPGEGKPGEGKPGEGKPGEGKPGEGKPGEGKPGEGKPGEGKPGEGKPGEGKPGEGKPGEGKPGEGKPGEGKPGEGKPGEGKPGERKPGEGKPGEGKPGEGKPGEGKPGDNAGEGAGDEQQGPLNEASESGAATVGGGAIGGDTGAGGTDHEAQRQDRDMEWGDQDLAHARNAADLAIEHLKKAVNTGDSSVLDDLGWTPDQARAFLERWEAMRRMARSGDPRARGEFDQAVKSLGLRPTGVGSSRDVPADAKGGQAEGRRSRPPSDYREQFKAFLQGAAAE